MHVVHVIAAARRGGAEQLLLLIGRELQRSGTQTSVVFFDDGPMRERFESAGLSCRVLGGHGACRPSAILRIARVLADVRPDVVHFHGVRALTHGAPAASLTRTPVVYSTHAVSSVKNATYGRLAPGYLWLEGRCSRAFAAAVVATSERMRADLVETGGIDRDMVRVIPPCIDLDVLPPVTPFLRAAARARFGLEGRVVGMVGRLIPVKGHAVMLHALTALPDTTLLLAGDGPERGALDSLAEALGIRERVVRLGDTSDVAAVFHASDVVAYPSTQGIIGLAALEAMACGVPLVASEQPGVLDFVDPGRTGLLSPAGDAVALARTVRALLDDRRWATAIADAGRDEVRERFGPAAVAQAYRDLYGAIVPATAANAA